MDDDEIMCVNHPEWPANPADPDDGPPLCEDCAHWYVLPGEYGDFDDPDGQWHEQVGS